MFLKILKKGTTVLVPDKVELLKPKDRTKLEHGTVVQFLPWVPKKLYLCKRTTTSGVLVADVLKFVIDEREDSVEWRWKSTTHRQVYYTQGVEPYKPIQIPSSIELVYLPTGEIVKSTDMCDGVHAVCNDIQGNRWLINCTLLAKHEVQQKAEESNATIKFDVDTFYTSSGRVFNVNSRGVTYINVTDLCGNTVDLQLGELSNEEFAEFPDGTRVFARSQVQRFTQCS